MKTTRWCLSIGGIALVASAILILAGCGEKDVPYVVDADEIARYLRETEQGRQLFRQDSLILPTPYQIPGDSTTYRDSVLIHGRETDVIVDSQLVDYGSLGDLYEAVAFVLDTFRVRRYRVSDNQIMDSNSARYLSRVGFFLKLGSDAQPYVGWTLWGFGALTGSTTPMTVTVSPAGGTPYSGDVDLYTATPKHLDVGIKYIRLSEIAGVAGGAKISVAATTANTLSPIKYFQLLSSADNDGYFMRPMDRVDVDHYVDTLTAPTNDLHLYEITMLQSFDVSDGKFSKAWVFPYRILQK